MHNKTRYKITIKDKSGNEKVFENVTSYRHSNGNLEIQCEDHVEKIPLNEVKHSYIGMPSDDNMIREMNG